MKKALSSSNFMAPGTGTHRWDLIPGCNVSTLFVFIDGCRTALWYKKSASSDGATDSRAQFVIRLQRYLETARGDISLLFVFDGCITSKK